MTTTNWGSPPCFNVVAAQIVAKSDGLAPSRIEHRLDLNKLAADNCQYLSECGFISYPDELTTGSSIMP